MNSEVPEWAEIINKKYARAHEHSVKLATWIEEWRERNNPHVFTAARNQGTGQVTLYVAINEWPGFEISVMLGDWINNLRSMLDYMVVRLWEVGPTDVNPKGNASFPMARSVRHWEKRTSRPSGTTCVECGVSDPRAGQLFGVAADALAVIEQHQPHFKTGKFDPCHPLASLTELSNTDKHNGIFPIKLAHISAIPVTSPDGSHTVPWYPAVSQEDTAFFPMEIPLEAAEAYLNLGLALEPRLEFPKHTAFISQVIIDINKWTAQVVKDLRPFLGPEFIAGSPQPLQWPPDEKE